ncbi:MAG TPA: AraC family transcriptional regulator [Steroidobacteraceae bacterium]|jgi:AraC family transcriptional activator of mtrCDE
MGQPIIRISRADLDTLLTALEVGFVKLSECLVSPGWQLELPGTDAPGIHYNLGGIGRMIVADQPPIDLHPHTLAIVPARHPFRIEVPDQATATALKAVDGRQREFSPETVTRYVAGDGEPKIMLICGYFRASFGAVVDLFASLPCPIVEQFEAADQVDFRLRTALAELIAQEVGAGAMTTSLLKQVLVTLLRRSLSSMGLWVERFATLRDPAIARAFASMLARPSAPHSVLSLSQTGGLSRSAFMARFNAAFGDSPMTILRKMRMRRAAILLTANDLQIERIARDVGYASRSSFVRAFRSTYGAEPKEYREMSRAKPSQSNPASSSGTASRRRKNPA